MSRRSDRAPGMIRMRSAASSSTETGRPRNSATRSARAAAKSSSPFIARRVISATCGAQADEIGQLVEHLVLDDRRFEIGDEQPLAAPCERLHDHVDRGLADRLARGAFGHGGRDAARAEDRTPLPARANPVRL